VLPSESRHETQSSECSSSFFSRFKAFARWPSRYWILRGFVRTSAADYGWRHGCDFAGNIDRRLLLGSFPKHDYRRGTTGPGRQHIGAGNEFDDECGQQQHVKPERPGNQDHCHHIQSFIDHHPAEGSERQLERVGAQCHGDGKPYPLPGQRRTVYSTQNTVCKW
jgi:hypothetical protein